MTDPLFKKMIETSAGEVYDRSDFRIEDVSDNLAQATRRLYKNERRLNDRVSVKGCEIQLRPVSKKVSTWYEAEPEDFSLGGLRFKSDLKLRRGELIWLQIKPDIEATGIDPFEIGAQVRHTSPAGNHFLVGVQFRPEMIKNFRRNQVHINLERMDAFLRALGFIDKEF